MSRIRSPFRWPFRTPAVEPSTMAPEEAFDDVFGEGFLTRLEALRLLAGRQHRGLHPGERLSRELGHGLEFADRRAYTPGDDIRSVDWNVLARLDEAHVRLNQRDADLPVRIAVDASASMHSRDGRKHRLARQIAAALAYIALASHDRVSLCALANGDANTLPLMRGKAQIFAIFDFLRRCWPSGATDLRASCTRLASKSERAGTTIVISDFYDLEGASAGLNHLCFHKHDVIGLQIIDPDQANPARVLALGATRLLDSERQGASEAGDAATLTDAWLTTELLRDYAVAHAAYCRELERACKRRHIGFVQVSTDMALERAVLTSLRMQGVVQ